MATHPAAPLLAADLGRLQHTNNRGETGYIYMPGFHRPGASDEENQANGALALGIAEGIIETLSARHRYRVIHEDELEAKVQDLADQNTTSQDDSVDVHCNRCRTPLFLLHTARDTVKIDADTIAAAQTHMDICR